jgi:chemotaxis protein methyltransferase CheR
MLASSSPNADFEYVRRLVRERAAIVLEDGKAYLAESRLVPVARREGFGSVAELIARIRDERFGPLHRKVVEAMATNETSFFRDVHPFDALRTAVLPDVLARRAAERTFHVWCAAASTGQEPYSVAMLLREHFPQLAGWTVRLLATDLSTDVLGRARAGRFTQLEVNRGLPAAHLVRYFERQGPHWVLGEEVRRMVEFRELNLAEPWPVLPPMDVVLLRNVLIYFDLDTKREILAKLRRVLRPDGWLFLGGAETTLNVDDAFERVQVGRASAYRVRSA